MSKSILDAWFGPKDFAAQQSYFFEETVPIEILMRGLEPHFKVERLTILDRDNERLFPTSISQIAVIYPWLLRKLEIKDDIEIITFPGDENSEASVIGTKLHEADVLFNLVLNIINEKFQPWEIGAMLPTASDFQVSWYQRATDGIELRELVDEEQVFQVFSLAWKKYLEAGGFVETANLPMFDNMGLFDPAVHENIIYSSEMLDYGIKLARAWASAIFFTQPSDSWEFYRHALTQREVMVVMNLDCGLQIQGRLDSVTRLIGEHSKVTTQVTDLKTGTPRDGLAYEVEIKFREAQIALLLAEWFTASFMRGNKSLIRRGEAFARRGKHDNQSLYGRSRFGYRYFDKETGVMSFEEVVITAQQREEFNQWLIWYATAIRTFRPEIRNYLRSIGYGSKRRHGRR